MNKKPFSDILLTEVKLPKPLARIVKSNEPKPKLLRRLLDKELHKHPFAIPVFTIIALSFLTMFGLVFIGGNNIGSNDSHVVQLSVDDKRLTVPTKALTVQDFLERSKVKLKEGDIVEPATETQIDSDDFRVNVYRAKPVTIVDGGKRIQALSAATTPRSIAAQAGVQVHAEDRITQANPKDVLRDQVLGTELVIERATPVSLNLYGTAVTVRTHSDTVADLLKEKNVSVAGSDTVMPVSHTAITPRMQIFITRLGTKIETKTEDIPNEQQIVEDTNLSFGTVALRQAGSPGKKLVTYQIELQNGVEIGRKVIQEVRVQEPVARITARGKAVSIPADKTAWMVAAGINQNDYPYVNYIISHENALWCPTRWQGQRACPPYYVELYLGAESNPSLGYGLCQSTPANKMAANGDDWRTNAVTQLKWCSAYANRVYGGWEGAYNAWTRRLNDSGRGWW